MSAETTVPRAGVFSRPQALLLVVGAIVVLWCLLQQYLVALVLVAIAVLFVLGLKKPVWLLAALLVSQLTLTSFMVTTPLVTISLRLLLLLLTLLVMAKAFIRKEVQLGPAGRRLIVPLVLFIAVTVVSNMVNVGFDIAYKDFRNMVSALLFVVLLPAIVDSPKQLRTVVTIVCVIVTASAVIGVMQHFRFLGMNQATLIPGFLYPGEPRVPGMGETELELAYVISAILVAIAGVLLLRGSRGVNTKLLLVAVAIMLAALYFTYTRSALLALGFGLLSLVPLVKTRIRWEIILAVLFLAIGFLEASNILGNGFLGGRSETGQLESSMARPILRQAAIAIALDHPLLGIGADQFLKLSPQYANRVDPKLLKFEQSEYWSYSTLGSEQPHNDFLGTWASYGTLALILYAWLIMVMFRNLADSFRGSKSRFLKGLSAGLAAALITYAANAFYHNIAYSISLLWILGGMSLVVAKLAAREQAANSLRVGMGRSVN